jgi:hypothetical protein
VEPKPRAAGPPLSLASTLGALLLLATHGAAATGIGLTGLDRLYFTRVTDAGPPSLHASAVRAALPARLDRGPRAGDAVRDDEGHEVEVSIADFQVPGGRKPPIVLREVRDTSHRIHLVWWAVYAGDQRQDCWFFSASPERTERKALANPAIERVLRTADGTIAIDMTASMLRPQGAEWTSAWTLTFEETAAGLDYRHAEERYGMSRGYDTGDASPPTSYWTARRVDGSVELRIADEVPEATLESCGADTRDTEAVARCVTAAAKVRTTVRPIRLPAFIERGGRPLE